MKSHWDRNRYQEPLFDPLRLISVLIQRRWLIAILFVSGLLVGLAFTWTQPLRYRAVALLEVAAPAAKVLKEIEVISDGEDQRVKKTAMERLKSRSLYQSVVVELGLENRRGFGEPVRTSEIARQAYQMLGLSLSAKTSEVPKGLREERAIGALASGVGISSVRGTNIIAVSFAGGNPTLSAKIANQLVDSYVEQETKRNTNASTSARRFIAEQLAHAKKRLQSSEQALLAYAKNEQITINGEETSFVAANMQSINDALAKTIQTRLELSRQVEQIDRGMASVIPDVVNSEGHGKLRQRIAELRADYRNKLATFKPNFPAMKNLRGQIEELDKQEKRIVGAFASSIRLKHEAAILGERDLRIKLAELEQNQRTFLDKKVQYTILKREVDSDRAQYAGLINKMNDIGISVELRGSNAEIVERAVTPRAAYSPRLLVNLAIALAIAMLLIGILIYLQDLLDDCFSSPDQVEAYLDLPVLGVLPKVKKTQLAHQLSHRSSGIGEAYQSLRTALQFASPGGVPPTVLITSATPKELKSTTAKRLAVEFSAIGKRVLLVDCDFRKPDLHRQFGVENVVGLSSFLSGNIAKQDVSNVFHNTRYANLTLVTSGPLPLNPSDLLQSERMSLFLTGAADHYDLIIVDGPPVLGLSDAPILAQQADATLFVAAHNQVARRTVVDAVKRLRASGGKIIGVAITRFDMSSWSLGNSYHHMQREYFSYGERQAFAISNPGTPHENDTEMVTPIIDNVRKLRRNVTRHFERAA